MNDLDTIIRNALLDDATRAPRLPETWGGPATSFRDVGRRRSRQLRYAALAGAAAVIIVALALLIGRSSVDRVSPAPAVDSVSPATAADRVSPATGWQPPGTEFPSQDLGAPTALESLTVSGLARTIRVAGQPDLTISTELTYAGGHTAELERCLSVGGGAGCTPEWNPAPLGSLGITSSVDNGVADDDLWTWQGVPTGAAYVVYGNSAEQRWQRPIAGVVVFPNQPGVDGAVAYDINGHEVARIDAALADAAAQGLRMPELADISKDQFSQLQQLTATTLHDCLINDGATIAGNVADTTTNVWDRCVNQTKATVTDAVDALHPRFYDPSTERPTNSDPAMVYGS